MKEYKFLSDFLWDTVWIPMCLCAKGLSSMIIISSRFLTSKLMENQTYLLQKTSVLITVASIFVFMIPVESGEKVSLGITIILSYTIILLVVSDITPRTGNGEPYLTLYIVASMITTTMSLFMTVFIVSIFHQSPEKEVPRWLKNYVLVFLAKITCYTRRNQEKNNFPDEMKYKNGNSKGGARPFVVSHHAGQNHHMQGPRHLSKDVDPRIAAFGQAKSQNAADPNQELSGLSGSHFFDSNENVAMSKNEDDWKELSGVLDRLGLILTFLFVVALCLFLFIGIRT